MSSPSSSLADVTDPCDLQSAPAVTETVSTSSSSFSAVSTPYAAEARYRNSQHLDNNPLIGKLIQGNRHAFEQFVVKLGQIAQENGVPDSPEYSQAIHLLEQAKDAMGRALIHAVGTCKGVPFEEAVVASSHKLKRARPATAVAASSSAAAATPAV